MDGDGFLAPYAMVLYRHGLYAIGARLKADDDDVRTAKLGVFAIERFSEAEHLRARSFEIPPNFNIRNTLHGAFGPHIADPNTRHDVVVEFTHCVFHGS